MPKNVFVFNPRARPSDQAARIARFSGSMFAEPNWMRSYALAARTLLQEAEKRSLLPDLGLPIFYLQRHTLELALKVVLGALLSLEEDWRVAGLSDSDYQQTRLTALAIPDWFYKHDLETLASKADELLHQLDLKDPLPSDFHRLAKCVATFERGHADRARYDRLRPPRRASTPAPHLSLPRGEETVLELGQIQDGIEALLEGPLRCKSLADDTFLAGIAQEQEACFQKLQRMDRIE